MAAELEHLKGSDLIVLGLPRGGVPVADAVAGVLGAAMDVIVVRKLGVPYQPELAFGAVGEGGVTVLNDEVVHLTGLDEGRIDQIARRARAEVDRRAVAFRRGSEPLSLVGREAVIVDDGVATGATARAACLVARAHHPKRLVLAVPVGAPDTIESLRAQVDEVVCLHTPSDFESVGSYYRDFRQVSDQAVIGMLASRGSESPSPSTG